MAEKINVLVVCGYGCHLNTPLGNIYLPKVVRFFMENKPDLVIFCGGFTQKKTVSDISEAELMRNSVLHQLVVFNNTHRFALVTETDSYTTYENIEKAGEKIYQYQVEKHIKHYKSKITIFCEAQRAPNVVLLARHFMINLVESIDDITVETASWERADPFKQVYNMIYNRLAIKFPYLANRKHKKRLQRSKFI